MTSSDYNIRFCEIILRSHQQINVEMISSDMQFYSWKKQLCVPINKWDMSRICNITTMTSYLKQYPKVKK